MTSTEHMDAIIDQWATEQITNSEFMALLISALEQLKGHLSEEEP